MPKPVDRYGLRRLMLDGAQIVDVLPREEFAEEHLPGAISVPLKELDARSAARLHRDRAVVLYCHDLQ